MTERRRTNTAQATRSLCFTHERQNALGWKDKKGEREKEKSDEEFDFASYVHVFFLSSFFLACFWGLILFLWTLLQKKPLHSLFFDDRSLSQVIYATIMRIKWVNIFVLSFGFIYLYKWTMLNIVWQEKY